MVKDVEETYEGYLGEPDPATLEEPPVNHLLDAAPLENAPATATYTVVVDGLETTLQLSDADARRRGLLGDAP